MNLRRIAAVAGLLAIVGAALHQASTAAPPESNAASNDFAVRYARAQLRVAELTLQKAQEMNSKIADTLAVGTVEQFADDVEFAKAQLESAMRGGSNDPFQAWLRRAEIRPKTARRTAASSTSAGPVPPSRARKEVSIVSKAGSIMAGP